MSCREEAPTILLRYAIPYWRRLSLVLLLSLAGTVLSLVLPYLTKDLVNRALLGRDTAALVRILVQFAAITIASFLLNVVSGLRYTQVSADILFDMRLALYRHLQQLSPRFYARTRLGEIVSRLNNDVAEIQRIAAETALAWVGNVLYLVGSVAMLVWLDARLFLASVVLLPASIWALTRYRKRLESKVADVRQTSADIGSFLIETLQGMRLVVTSNAQDREAARFRHHNAGFVRALMSMQRLGYLAGGLPGLILSAGGAVVFLYGGLRVIQGTLTMGALVAFLAYQMRLWAPIQALMSLYASLATARVSLARVGELFDAHPEVQEAPDAAPVESIRGDISFENVSFSFDRGAPVLDGVSFRVEAGETLAIVGPSGSGKSTIADLLVRLLDPDSGTVRLDGRDLRTLRLAGVRRHVAVVDQTPFLFHASVAENLRYTRPEATDDELHQAARAAGIDAFIATLPHGYETVVGERGAALSAGERQRLAIGRALLTDPEVLILDEPTAALDPVTERRVVSGLDERRKGRTTIIITHRMELAAHADHVIVLDGARILETRSAAVAR